MDKENKNNTENIVLNNVFYNKPLYTYLFKKVTKLFEALYLVTDLIKDSEPLKRSLRIYVLNSMTLTNFTKDTGASLKGLCAEILTLQNLLDVAKNHQLIGVMNHSILEKELRDLVVLLNQEIALSSTLPQDFFYEAMPEAERPIKDTSRHSTPENQSVFYKGHSKRQSTDMSFKNSLNNGAGIEKTNKTERRQQILDIVKGKENLTIKDIASQIKDCSEKTIQRELVQMLSLGLLKKTGERRWSRYSTQQVAL